MPDSCFLPTEGVEVEGSLVTSILSHLCLLTFCPSKILHFHSLPSHPNTQEVPLSGCVLEVVDASKAMLPFSFQMMKSHRKMSGRVYKVYEKPASSNEGACLRLMMK